MADYSAEEEKVDEDDEFKPVAATGHAPARCRDPATKTNFRLRWDQRFESAFLQRRVRKLSVPSANPV